MNKLQIIGLVLCGPLLVIALMVLVALVVYAFIIPGAWLVVVILGAMVLAGIGTNLWERGKYNE